LSGFVEHGRTIWQLALVALVASGALAALWAPGLGRRVRALVARRRVGQARSVEGLADGMIVTLTGELRARGAHFSLTGEAARTVSLDGTLTHLRTDDVHLAVAGASGTETLVELAGPIEVALGSAEATARVSEEGGSARVRTRVVRPGDRVRVRGALEACAGEAAGVDYRTAAQRFRLVADRRGVPLRLLAEGAANRPVRRGLALLRGAAIGALAFGLLFVAGGAAARHAARSAGPGDPALRPGWGLSAASFAAATPFHRGAVFDVVEAALRERPRARLADATMALGRASEDDCTSATRALVHAGELGRAAARGAGCADPAARLEAARAHLALAQYDEADRLYRPLVPRLDDGDRAWALVAQVLGSRPSPWTVRDEDRCILVGAATATAGLGGDFAREQLRRALRDDGPTRRTCALLLAPHLSGRDRDEVLSGTVAADDPFAVLLQIAEDPSGERAGRGLDAAAVLRDDVSLVLGLAEPRHGLVPALEQSLLPPDLPRGASRAAWERRVWLAADVAAVASLAGRHGHARAALATAARAVDEADAAGSTAGLAVPLHELGAAIELRAGDLRRAAVHVAEVPAGDPLADRVRAVFSAAAQDDPDVLVSLVGEGWRARLERAARGDGRPLARKLAVTGGAALGDAAVLPAIVARVRKGRETLRAWARWDGSARAREQAGDPLLHLALSARQLDLARALEDGPRVRELEGTVSRLSDLLSRADLALPAALVPPPTQ